MGFGFLRWTTLWKEGSRVEKSLKFEIEERKGKIGESADASGEILEICFMFFLLLGSDFCGEWLHNCGYYEYYYREMRYKMNKIGNSNKNSKIVVEKSFLFIRALQTTKMYV